VFGVLAVFCIKLKKSSNFKVYPSGLPGLAMNQQFDNRTGICFMNSNMAWGGGEKWHYQTACYFRDSGFSVMVITNRESELFHKLKDKKGIILESDRIANCSFLNPFKLFHIRNLLIRQDISTVFLGLSSDVKLGGLAAKLAGINNIIYRRGAAVPVKNSLLNRYLFRSVLTAIITNSREIKNKIFQNNHQLIEERKVHIIYNGVDPQLWTSPAYTAKDEKRNQNLILGNAGRLVEQKGQKYLIKIAKQLKEKHIEFILYVAGTGKLEKSLKRDCIRNNLEKEIVFLDFVEDMQEFLAGLDIYLSTSLHEGSSQVIIEAMAAGKPVIAFDISSMPELIKNNETGYLVPFADTQLFAEKIVNLKNNRSELDTFGANARKLVERKFNYSKNMSQIIGLIKEKQ
jgi:glycosyltransferase involved in cell wall biosynthesis